VADHPVKVPSELVQQWCNEAPYGLWATKSPRERWLIDHAYAAGADQELEACCEWLGGSGYAGTSSTLRAARRPKPPTLAEQGLNALRKVVTSQQDYDALYAALNRLAELEAQQ
jgi:hypothetical protein